MTGTLAILASLAATTLTTAAFGDTTIRFVNSGPGGGESQVAIANGMVRADSPGGDQTYVLFSSDSNSFVAVNPSEQTYMEFDVEAIQKMVAMQKQAMEQLEAQLANVPPAQREQMRKMMGNMMPDMGGAPKPRRYERGGETTVAGYNCEMLKIYVGDELSAEQCVVDPGTLDIPDEDYATMRAMQQYVLDLVSQFSFMANAVMEYGEPGENELPISYTTHHKMVGKMSGELKSISFDGIPSSQFEIPAGYKRQKMPELER
jgi:hypothetical protein